MKEKDSWIIERFSGGKYEATTDGLLISHCGREPRVLKSFTHPKTGYLHVAMRDSAMNKSFCCLVHRVVALVHIPNPSQLPQVNHVDGNKLNNSVENLEWVSAAENIAHSLRIGLKVPIVGEGASWSKLSREQVIEIRSLRDKGMLYREIAEMFGIHKMTVGEICRKEIWRNV